MGEDHGSSLTLPHDACRCRPGGLTDLWYLDDSTVALAPALALASLRAYDRETQAQGGTRNVLKTKLILYAAADRVLLSDAGSAAEIP